MGNLVDFGFSSLAFLALFLSRTDRYTQECIEQCGLLEGLPHDTVTIDDPYTAH